VVVDTTGHQDHVDVRVLRLQRVHQREAVEPRHPDVQNGHIGIEAGGQLQGLARRGAGRHLVQGSQAAVNGAQHAWLVVYDEDARWSHG